MGCFRRMEVVRGRLQAPVSVDFPLTAGGRRPRFPVHGCLITLQQRLHQRHRYRHYEGWRRLATRLCRCCLSGLRSRRLSHDLPRQAPDQLIFALLSAYRGTSMCPPLLYSVAHPAHHHGYPSEGRGMPIGPCSVQLVASRCSSHQTAGC